MKQTETASPKVEFCSLHPYRYLFASFWLVVALICGRLLLGRPEGLLAVLTGTCALAALYSFLAARCVVVAGMEIIATRQPFGRLAQKRWPLTTVQKFSWDANRAFADQIQTRPLQFNVYAHLRSGRVYPLLVYYRESEAADAAGALNAYLPALEAAEEIT